jgi:phage terminase large subunit-like protein
MSRVPKFWTQPLQGYDPWKDADDFIFDGNTARSVCNFFHDRFRHEKGEFAGKPFELLDWEKQFLGHLFGWKRKSDGTRRYREALLYIPKKNGKTEVAAGIGIIMTVADNEPGSEVYAASGDKDQASLIFSAASHFVETDELLSEHVHVFKGYRAMKYDAMGSIFKVLSSEAKTKHGPNVHCAIFDEVHAFPNNDLIETLRRGTISRRQPLTLYLTTADYAGDSPCNKLLEQGKQIRDGILKNPHFLPMIYECFEGEDWTSEETWKRVNPSYGVTVKRSYFVEEVEKAKTDPVKENSFKRLHLNMQTKVENRWMRMQDWDASGASIQPDSLLGTRCYAAVDLASVNDIAALVLYFPDAMACLCRFWVPRDTAKTRLEYQIWEKEGYITVSEGRVIDQGEIMAELEKLKSQYMISAVAYDPWNAAQFALAAARSGFEMVEFRQGYKSMTEPTKELMKDVMRGALTHFGHPVLRWMASNANSIEDDAENVKLVKPGKDSPKKIDGIIALVMARGMAMAASMAEGDSVMNEDPEEFEKLMKEIYRT